MKRGWNIFWVGLMVAVAVVTYAMKDSAGRAADQVMQLRADIAREKDQLNVLRAEWSVLDQPARLQSLVARYNDYLALKPLDVRQLGTIADVPAKPPVESRAGIDDVRTGSIAAPAKSKIDKPVAPRRHAAAPQPAPKAKAAPAELETGFLQ